MNRRKFLLGSAATLTGSGLLVGAQGYSSVEADRGVTVDVVGDEEAYLRFDYSEPSDSFPCGTTSFTLIDEIRNQATEPLTTVTLKIKSVPANISIQKDGTSISAGDTVKIVDADGPEDNDALGIGQEETDIELKTVCNGGVTNSGPLRFDLEVKGEDTVVETERPEDVTIDCDCPQVDGVRFMGQGNAEILTEPRGEAFEDDFTV